MSDLRPDTALDTALVPNPTRSDDDYGNLSHVERINPGDNPAADPWAAGAYPVPDGPPDERGPQRMYAMLMKGTHNGVLLRAGSVVVLYDDEVGPQHALLPNPPIDPRPAVETPPMASVQDPRDAEIARLQAAASSKEDGLQRLAAACADLQDQLRVAENENAKLREELDAAQQPPPADHVVEPVPPAPEPAVMMPEPEPAVEPPAPPPAPAAEAPEPPAQLPPEPEPASDAPAPPSAA